MVTLQTDAMHLRKIQESIHFQSTWNNWAHHKYMRKVYIYRQLHANDGNVAYLLLPVYLWCPSELLFFLPIRTQMMLELNEFEKLQFFRSQSTVKICSITPKYINLRTAYKVHISQRHCGQSGYYFTIYMLLRRLMKFWHDHKMTR